MRSAHRDICHRRRRRRRAIIHSEEVKSTRCQMKHEDGETATDYLCTKFSGPEA